MVRSPVTLQKELLRKRFPSLLGLGALPSPPPAPAEATVLQGTLGSANPRQHAHFTDGARGRRELTQRLKLVVLLNAPHPQGLRIPPHLFPGARGMCPAAAVMCGRKDICPLLLWG